MTENNHRRTAWDIVEQRWAPSPLADLRERYRAAVTAAGWFERLAKGEAHLLNVMIDIAAGDHLDVPGGVDLQIAVGYYRLIIERSQAALVEAGLLTVRRRGYRLAMPRGGKQ